MGGQDSPRRAHPPLAAARDMRKRGVQPAPPRAKFYSALVRGLQDLLSPHLPLGVEYNLDATIVLVPKGPVHLRPSVELDMVGDDERRIDLSLADAI
jgi:hypothetical protein